MDLYPYIHLEVLETCLMLTLSSTGFDISDESVFPDFLGRNERHMLWTTDEKEHPCCHPGSVTVWGCPSAVGTVNLHFCDGTINAETDRDFKAPCDALKMTSFSKDINAFFNKAATFSPTEAWLWKEREQGLQSWPLPRKKSAENFGTKNWTTLTMYCCTPEDVLVGKTGIITSEKLVI